jgi:hypothetical protein
VPSRVYGYIARRLPSLVISIACIVAGVWVLADKDFDHPAKWLRVKGFAPVIVGFGIYGLWRWWIDRPEKPS